MILMLMHGGRYNGSEGSEVQEMLKAITVTTSCVGLMSGILEVFAVRAGT